MTREQFSARICHACWVAYQIGAGQEYHLEPTEADLNSHASGLAAILANPELTPEASHENWMAYRLSEGWKYGPVKDPAKKEHPDLVPFAELPLVEQQKDDNNLFAAKFALELWNRTHS